MIKIRELLKLKKVIGDIGIEIEVEGENLPEAPGNWRADEDGSLRGESAEYVMRNPVAYNRLLGELNLLEEVFNEDGVVITESYRAGIHVHVNVQELTVPQLFNYITLFTIFEDVIVAYCNKSRQGNHFCLRTKDAGYLPQLLTSSAHEGNLSLLCTDAIRYSAMNITSVFKYGSVEFRSLESTKDFNKIYKWATILYNLREKALKFKDPQEIIYAVSMGGYEKFTKEVLGDYADRVYKQDGWEKSVKSGIRIAQDIAFARKWGMSTLDIFDKKMGVF